MDDGAEPLGPTGGSAPEPPGGAAPAPGTPPGDDLELIAPLDLGDEDDDPLLAPDPARAAFWLGAGELERGAYFHASRSFKAAAEHSAVPGGAPPGGASAEHAGAPADAARSELARGLFHLAVAGFKGLAGDPQGKARQLAHARRRLAPFGPRHEELDLDLAELIARVEADTRGPADSE